MIKCLVLYMHSIVHLAYGSFVTFIFKFKLFIIMNLYDNLYGILTVYVYVKIESCSYRTPKRRGMGSKNAFVLIFYIKLRENHPKIALHPC